MPEPAPEPNPRRRDRALAVVAVALVASLAGNVYLLTSEEAQRAANNAVRLDPAGTSVYASERAKPRPAGPPVLALFGDSRALMWASPALPGYQVVNRGIGNQTTGQILLRVDTDIAPLHPAVVVFEGGINDLKTIPELPGRRADIVATCEANLRAIVQRLRAGGATVVLTTVFSIGDVPLWRKPFWSDDVALSIREVNTFLRPLTGDGVVLFDANAVLDDERGKIKPPYQFDYLHVASPGYAALDEKLVPLVKALPSAPR